MACEPNCTSNGFSCNVVDLAINQSPRGVLCDIFHKHNQPPEYAGIDMICMPHVHVLSSIFITAKFGLTIVPISLLLLSWALSITSSTGSAGFCSCKALFVCQVVSLILLLKNGDYPLKILPKRTRGLFNITELFRVFRMILYISCNPTWSLFTFFLLSCLF
jgi:hypothetical protein